MEKASPPTDRRHLEAALLPMLGPVRQAVRRALEPDLRGLGLSIAQAQPLLVMAENDGLRQRELAERLDIEGPSLVRLLDQLQSMGLVERRPDPEDLRAKTLHLTPAGKRMTGRLEPLLVRLRSNLLAGVPTEDLATCLRVLESLVQAAAGRESTAYPR